MTETLGWTKGICTRINLGRRSKKLRIEKGWSREKLAEKAGIRSAQPIRNIERQALYWAWIPQGGRKTLDEFEKAGIPIEELAKFMIRHYEISFIDNFGILHVHAGVSSTQYGKPFITRQGLARVEHIWGELTKNLNIGLPRDKEERFKEKMEKLFETVLMGLIWVRANQWLDFYDVHIDYEGQEKILKGENPLYQLTLDYLLARLGVYGIVFGHDHHLYLHNYDNRLFGIDFSGGGSVAHLIFNENGIQLNRAKATRRFINKVEQVETGRDNLKMILSREGFIAHIDGQITRAKECLDDIRGPKKVKVGAKKKRTVNIRRTPARPWSAQRMRRLIKKLDFSKEVIEDSAQIDLLQEDLRVGFLDARWMPMVCGLGVPHNFDNEHCTVFTSGKTKLICFTPLVPSREMWSKFHYLFSIYHEEKIVGHGIFTTYENDTRDIKIRYSIHGGRRAKVHYMRKGYGTSALVMMLAIGLRGELFEGKINKFAYKFDWDDLYGSKRKQYNFKAMKRFLKRRGFDRLFSLYVNPPKRSCLTRALTEKGCPDEADTISCHGAARKFRRKHWHNLQDAYDSFLDVERWKKAANEIWIERIAGEEGHEYYHARTRKTKKSEQTLLDLFNSRKKDAHKI
jgi:transcriptional regulator with XRE-family HTH domain